MSSLPTGLPRTYVYGEEVSADPSDVDLVASSNSLNNATFSKEDRSEDSRQTITSGFELEKNSAKHTTRELGEENVADDDPVLRDLPWHVRRVVSLHDDTTLPTITFRYFVLTFLFIAPGAFLAQLNVFRTTYAPYSIFFVQIAANYVGDWLASALPAWEVKIPFTRKSFNLNPGPFSVKEHVLVVIAAASGATYNLAYTPLALSELYFGKRIDPAVSIFFMWGVVWIGYSYAALARQFLIYDPQYPWYATPPVCACFEIQS
jgi:hypothetical protein